MEDEQIAKMVEQSLAVFSTVTISVGDAEKVAQVKQVVTALANEVLTLRAAQKAASRKKRSRKKRGLTKQEAKGG